MPLQSTICFFYILFFFGLFTVYRKPTSLHAFQTRALHYTKDPLCALYDFLNIFLRSGVYIMKLLLCVTVYVRSR